MYSLRGRKSSRATNDQLNQFNNSRQKLSQLEIPQSIGTRIKSSGPWTWPVVGPLLKVVLYTPHVHILLVMWLFIIYWGERYYPYHELQKCQWPSGLPDKAQSSSVKPFDFASPSVARVALVADPQLVDDNTYPKRNKAVLSIVKYIVDGYLRRNWVNMHKVLDPDTTIFLGDLFDGGREWSDVTWIKEFDRWNRIFTKPENKRTVMSLPGNHDIGFGDTLVPAALERFEAFFGPPSSTIDVANHTFILLDTISMISEVNESIYMPPRQFLDGLPDYDPTQPRFLLSHIPLFRDKNADCGKDRESNLKSLPYVRGYQFQTLIPPDVSSRILSKVNPSLVFSGDDHDACHVKHIYKDTKDATMSTDEYTVKSFSMAMGISQPGIQLISLDGSRVGGGAAGREGPSFQTSLCLLPSPFKAFIVYSIWGVASGLLVLVVSRFPQSIPRPLQRILLPRINRMGLQLQSPTLPLTNTDSPFAKNGFEPAKQRTTVLPWSLVWAQTAFFVLWVIVLFMFQHRKLFLVGLD